MQEDRIQKWCALILLALVVAVTLLGLRMSLARTLFPGQYAQVDPAVRCFAPGAVI
jgi:VanZ family protein